MTDQPPLTILQQSLLNTLSYFDTFDYPLTLVECWKWLYVGEQALDSQPTLNDIWTMLTSAPLASIVDTDQNFFFLKDRQAIINERHWRTMWADRKYKRAMKMIQVLRWFPFVRMMAVCNTLALSHSRNDSDIDLFIIAAPGRIWTARFWTTVFLKLFGLRPSHGQARDKICLSFYIDADHLDLSDLAIPDDIYLTYWLDQLVPIYDPMRLASKLRQANPWVQTRLPLSYGVEPIPQRQVSESFGSWLVRHTLETVHGSFIGHGLEKIYRRIQLKILPAHLRAMANTDQRVVVNDWRLKFHENDRRQTFIERWQQRRQQILDTLRP